MPSLLVLSEGDTRNRWRDGQVCPDVGQGTMAPWARRPGCVLACDAQIGRGRPRDFCDLPIRRDKGRVVNTPLVFKKGSFSGERGGKTGESEERERGDGKGRRQEETEKESGERERERSPPCMEKGLCPEIGVKKTMNAGGVEKRID
ncbi:hypothetical protein TNCV_4959531 [Trichonephila clavipes]|uniref:Uncharacterized protein n=1 Tax=Trichonephila clavipes TaxID=2585209 RepID=A0A8X6VMG5_TRICX|nr:hypothetical protein TNCV_4959531 [Trichonephila clavipes]